MSHPVARQHLGVPGSHCVARALAVEQGATPPEGHLAAPPIDCFATFAEAISSATGGAVQLPAEVTPANLREEDLSGPGVTGTYVIGIEYKDSNYGGATLTVTSDYTCVGWNHFLPSMPSGWNDTISSARAYSNCYNSYHYEHSNYGGNVMNCRDYCSYIGATLNDRTSSIKWTQ